MTVRTRATWLPASLLALLLIWAGCSAPVAPEAETADGATDTPPGTTEVLEIETLDESEMEIVAVPLELTKSEERGLMIFRHYCTHCHGFTGEGDGQNSFALEIPPRNLLELELDGSRTDGELRLVISEGGASQGFAELMPPWGATLEPGRIDDLVALIHILPELEVPDDEEEIPTFDDDDMGDFSL